MVGRVVPTRRWWCGIREERRRLLRERLEVFPEFRVLLDELVFGDRQAVAKQEVLQRVGVQDVEHVEGVFALCFEIVAELAVAEPVEGLARAHEAAERLARMGEVFRAQFSDRLDRGKLGERVELLELPERLGGEGHLKHGSPSNPPGPAKARLARNRGNRSEQTIAKHFRIHLNLCSTMMFPRLRWSRIATCLLGVIGISSVSANEARDIGPALPEMLTKQEAEVLLRPGGAWFSEGSFKNFDGFGVAITSVARNSATLAVKADPRTNLGRFAGNVAGDHGGRLDFEIIAVLDENGHDIFNRKSERPHSGRVSPSTFENGHYPWTRTLPLSPRSELAEVREFKLRATLSLPVDWLDFTFEVGQVRDDVHPRITKADTTKSGVALFHPQPWPDAHFFVFGQDAEGRRLPVGASSSSKTFDVRAFNFGTSGKSREKIRVLIATDRTEESVDISLPAPMGERKPITVVMNRAVFADSLSATPKFVFTFNGVAYSTVEELHRAVDKLPNGSRINWRRSSYVYGGEPLNSAEELAAFDAYCKNRGVKLNVSAASE